MPLHLHLTAVNAHILHSGQLSDLLPIGLLVVRAILKSHKYGSEAMHVSLMNLLMELDRCVELIIARQISLTLEPT